MQSDMISRNKLHQAIKREENVVIKGKPYVRTDAVLAKISMAPSVDAVEVVRCRVCKESEPLSVIDTDCLYCGVWDTTVHCNGYCYHSRRCGK